MEEAVVPRRHVVLRHGLLEIPELLDPRSRIRDVGVPTGEVETFAAFGHVVVNKPGKGSEVGGPGPSRLVGMAVIAGLPERALDGRRCGEITSNGWIRVLEADGLRRGENAGERYQGLASHHLTYFAVIVPGPASCWKSLKYLHEPGSSAGW